ncbi:hypothetical protein CASFOL_004845 [Castilleja foliolosa]|uniref:Carboxypeptidase n=1 Tax=Castilleja foliolosa TaxID=1961234 RepID=A0ABD3EBX6_9LAMI
MKPLGALILLVLTLYLSCSVTAQSNGMKQTKALSHIYNSKLKEKNSSIDRSQFEVGDYFRAVKIHSQEGQKEKDRIERLPGQPPVKFKQYGGYVTVDQTNGREFYYYFVEAHHSKNTLPLLLWLNGGPGCSSIGNGAMEELGPFRVHSDGKTLYKNKFAWNHAANVLFLESPAGVGFSYSNTTQDFVIGGDRQTAIDNYVFLLNWLKRFPEYKHRDFYLSGESYAGHYVPQLAQTILDHNHKANKSFINLKGIIIGNAAINDETDVKGMYEYFASHAIISDDTLYQIQNYCDFSSETTDSSDECISAINVADKNIDAIDIYNIYAPKCSNSSLTNTPKKASVYNYDPCSDHYVNAYLNRPEVQEALHANVTNIPYDWQSCSHVIKKWQDSTSTVLPLLENFVENGLRVWIYSGDIDGRVPVTSTKLAIEKLKLAPKTSWLPWYLHGEVGGYAQVYEGNLTFATVRGSGHEVPSYQPARAISLILSFIAWKELPKSNN